MKYLISIIFVLLYVSLCFAGDYVIMDKCLGISDTECHYYYFDFGDDNNGFYKENRKIKIYDKETFYVNPYNCFEPISSYSIKNIIIENGNDDTIRVHTRKEILDSDIDKIKKICGITTIHRITKYELVIYKGLLFDWYKDKIVKNITNILD